MELKIKQKVVFLTLFLAATTLTIFDLIIRRYSVCVSRAVPQNEVEAVTIESCKGVEKPSDQNVR